MKNFGTFLCLVLFIFCKHSHSQIGVERNDKNPECSGAGEVFLFNGRIHTQDSIGSIVSELRIRNGRIVRVGGGVTERQSICETRVNLNGRTVIPGLIDSHIHFFRTGLHPGRRLNEIENVFSKEELIEVVKAAVDESTTGSWLTAFGGWFTQQIGGDMFLPTQQELDELSAHVPGLKIYIQSGRTGPAIVNTNARRFIEQLDPVIEFVNGQILQPQINRTYPVIDTINTYEDKVKNTRLLSAYLSRLGLTCVSDQGGEAGMGTPGTPGYFDTRPLSPDYEPILSVFESGDLTLRQRPFLNSEDARPDDPKARHGQYDISTVVGRANNVWYRVQDPYFRVAGLGESVVYQPLNPPDPSVLNPAYLHAVEEMARTKFGHQVHALNHVEVEYMVQVFFNISKKFPISDLHWTIAHLDSITEEQLNVLQEIGAGVTVQNIIFTYCPTLNGIFSPCTYPPNFRRIMDSGVVAGAGSDGFQVATPNPWNMIYFMVTGRTSNNYQFIPTSSTVTIEETIKMFTTGSAWALRSDHEMGSLEVGKFGDFTVLDRAIFHPDFDPFNLKDVRPLMTVVGGHITHSSIA